MFPCELLIWKPSFYRRLLNVSVSCYHCFHLCCYNTTRKLPSSWPLSDSYSLAETNLTTAQIERRGNAGLLFSYFQSWLWRQIPGLHLPSVTCSSNCKNMAWNKLHLSYSGRYVMWKKYRYFKLQSDTGRVLLRVGSTDDIFFVFMWRVDVATCQRSDIGMNTNPSIVPISVYC